MRTLPALLCGASGLLLGIGIQFLGMRSTAPAQAPPAAPQISEQELVDRFHRLYYDNGGRTWGQTRWLGVTTQKMPLDMWIYQEMLYEIQPDFVIECGTFAGGSALYFASIMDLMGKGKVITIDINSNPKYPKHPRIQYLTGSSTSPEIVAQVRKMIRPGDKVMVSLDSDHSKNHVLGEMRAYSPLVNEGSYLVVEDTNINGHPVFPSFGPGPMEALDAFLAENKGFVIDKEREKFYVSFNPRGYLKRVSTSAGTNASR